MSKRKLVQVWNSQEGYNSLAKEYKAFHDHLDSFEKGMFVKFLPRQREGLRILDLGAGDGRTHKYFRDMPIASYTACDIAQELLARHPKGQKIQTAVCDLDQDWPFEEGQVDVCTCFFVLEHLQDLAHFFAQCDKVLAPGGRVIIGHFLQRRAVVFKHNKDEFKIERINWRLEDIIEAGQYAFFDMHVEEVYEQSTMLGYIIVGEKK